MPIVLHSIFYHNLWEKKSVFVYIFLFLRYNKEKILLRSPSAGAERGVCMPQDAFTLRYIAKELDGALKGGHVNKIVQPSADEVHLIIYTGRKTVRLVLSANASDCGAYFEEADAEVPLVAPNFCMLLRKYLQGAELLGAELVGFERILRFTLRGTSEFQSAARELYLEVMGKYSNLILTEGGVILGALKTTTLDMSAKRMIFPGVPYSLPAPQAEKYTVSEEDPEGLKRALEGAPLSGDLGRYLFTHLSGLAPSTAEYLAETYRGGNLAEHILKSVFSDMVCPCVVLRDGVPVDFSARRTGECIPFETLSAAQTYYYGEKRAAKRREALRRRELSAVNASKKKHEKRLAQILEKQKECADAETLRIKGELLTANLYALARGMKGCELDNWYDPAGGKVKIALDPRLTPSENAQSYFKRYRKCKRTLEILAPQEEEVRAELSYLQSLAAAVSSAETEEDLLSCEEELVLAELLKQPEKRRKKQEAIGFRTFERHGFRIDAGRNNLQNDRLVRSASSEDIWLHTQRYHSCHVVIRTEGREVPKEVLQFAADVCAKYSDANGDRAPVDYCRVKYVKKPRGSKAGFVTYSDFSTLEGKPSRVG